MSTTIWIDDTMYVVDEPVRAHVDELEEELNKHRWIPVGERLPEHESKVLVSDGRYCWTDRYRYGKGRWECLIPGGGDNVEYTHWKPIILPEGE